MDRDVFAEILQTLRSHKTRTGLAVLTVAWGVFMLVLLLGAGRGIQNGVELQFRDDAVNSIGVYRGKTTMAYQGQPRGRSVKFNNQDFTAVRDRVDGVEHITSRYYPGGSSLVSYRGEQASYDIRAVHPSHKYLEKTIILKGRFLNDADIDQRRKVCVIGVKVREALFDGQPALGEMLMINRSAYRVVGVFRDEGGQSEQEKIYLPVSTAQLVYGASDTIHQFMYTVGDATWEQSQRSEQDVRELMSARLNVSPQDERAIRIYNNLEEYQKVTDLFYWVRIFVALVGAGTVLTGILAVSNIMVISVAERRREIGIRKALGATPGSISRLIVFESLAITTAAGYIGLLASLGLLELLKATIAENEYIYQPDVNTATVVSVTVLVVIAGTLAGYLPARKAAAVRPIEALRPA